MAQGLWWRWTVGAVEMGRKWWDRSVQRSFQGGCNPEPDCKGGLSALLEKWVRVSHIEVIASANAEKEMGWTPGRLQVQQWGDCCLIAQSCPTLCDPMDCCPPGSSVHGISQARILEWVAISLSRRSSQPRNWTRVSCIGRRVLYWWATRIPGDETGRVQRPRWRLDHNENKKRLQMKWGSGRPGRKGGNQKWNFSLREHKVFMLIVAIKDHSPPATLIYR